MPSEQSVVDAYDPETSVALAQCWINETINGQPNDFGDSEYACLTDADKGKFLATYKYRGGPTIGMCYQTSECGWQPPFGVREKCSSNKPWLRDMDSLKQDDHFQLQNVMGLDKDASAADTRSYAASMAGNTRSLGKAPCGAYVGSAPTTGYFAMNRPLGMKTTASQYPSAAPRQSCCDTGAPRRLTAKNASKHSGGRGWTKQVSAWLSKYGVLVALVVVVMLALFGCSRL